MIPALEDIEVERIHRGNDSEKKAERKSVNVDMNPMVDLAFLLLTFFMLATTFSKPQAMELLIPAKADASNTEKEMAVKESKTLSLVLHSDELTWYRGITDPETFNVAYDSKEFHQVLNTHVSTIDGLVVLIKPQEGSNYGQLVSVLDALNLEGVKRYAISELSEFDQGLNQPSDETTEGDGE